MMVSLVQWFRRVVGLPLGIEEPEEGAPLTGLAQEAAMLVAAFEGVDPNAQHASHEFSVWQVAEVLSDHAVFVADGEGNDGLAANERDRWVRDVDDWAQRARGAITKDHTPYRGGVRADRRLQETSDAVRLALRSELFEEASARLAKYVADVRRGATAPPTPD